MNDFPSCRFDNVDVPFAGAGDDVIAVDRENGDHGQGFNIFLDVKWLTWQHMLDRNRIGYVD